MAYQWITTFSIMFAMVAQTTGAPDSWYDNFWSTDGAVMSSGDDHTASNEELVKLASNELLEQDIMEEVFYNYNKEVRPATVASPVVFVKHALSLSSVNSVRNNELTVSGWQDISWFDARLIWDPTDYDNITIISVDNTKVWKPDIVLYNSASELSGIVHPDLKITIEFNGHVHYAPIIYHKTRCRPYGGVFNCKLKYGSWTYNAAQVSINNTKGHVELSNFEPDSDFKIVASKATNNVKKYACCPETYQDVTYNITMVWKDSDSFEGLSPIVSNGYQNVQEANFTTTAGNPTTKLDNKIVSGSDSQSVIIPTTSSTANGQSIPADDDSS